MTGLATHRSWIATLTIAAITGALFGPLDLAGQMYAPYPLAHLFNSPAVWAAAAFAFGAWARARHPATIVMMVIAVESYYLAAVVIGRSDVASLTSSTAQFWLALGVGAGIVFGTAGGWRSSARRWQRTTADALLPAVFGSEAVHRFVELATTAPDAGRDDNASYGAIVAVIAITLLIVSLRTRSRDERLEVVVLTLALVGVGSIPTVLMFG